MSDVDERSNHCPRRVLVFGGTFDPPHRAHALLPAHAAEQLQCDEIIYVPARLNPLKSQGPEVGREHRLAMLLLAIADVPNARISTLELDREGPSYTVDTLRRLRQDLSPDAPATHAAPDRPSAPATARTPAKREHARPLHSHASALAAESTPPRPIPPHDADDEPCAGVVDVRLLIGCDQALDFHRWRSWQEILSLATPAVMIRPPWNESSFHAALGQHYSQVEAECWWRWTLRLPRMDINATTIREHLRRGDIKAVEPMLQPQVLEYIRANRLYRSPA